MTISAAEKARRAKKAASASAAPPASSEPAPATRETKGTGGVKETTREVIVVCKLPRGMYLQLHEFVEQRVRRGGGIVETEQQPMRVGKQHRLKPTVLPMGALPNYTIHRGFSFTPVPADFWRKYVEQNPKLTMIEQGLLAGFDNEADARAYCNEFEDKKHGLEPLSQKDDPRVEKSFNPNLTDIEIDTDSHGKPATTASRG